MEEATRKFADLPEHMQLYLSSLLADVNYLKGMATSPIMGNDSEEVQYLDAKQRYEVACEREGIRPYDELVRETEEQGEEESEEAGQERGTGNEEQEYFDT